MTKFMDGLYKYFTWIIIVLSMLAYFAYQILDFEGDIGKTIYDWQTWVHVLFVIYLNVMMVSGAYDSGTSTGISTEEFNLADKLNNQIITSVNNEMNDFREYVKRLNHHELQSLRDDYLFKVGDKKPEELTKKEKKHYLALKPLRHDIYGFNLPLYYEMSKSGQVKYQSSIKKNQGKIGKQIGKVFTGLLFAGMTVNVAFAIQNVGAAFISLMIIGVGLILTYLLTFFPQVFKFKNDLPKKVILKKTLYDSYIDYKLGKHQLKKLGEPEEEPVMEKKPDEIKVAEAVIKEDDQPFVKEKEVNVSTEPIVSNVDAKITLDHIQESMNI